MLFILVMDVLSSLVMEAERLGLLAPLSARNIGNRISLYADDVILFTAPNLEDLDLLKAILQKFGNAFGLHTNMAKSSILPIRCDDETVSQA